MMNEDEVANKLIYEIRTNSLQYSLSYMNLKRFKLTQAFLTSKFHELFFIWGFYWKKWSSISITTYCRNRHGESGILLISEVGKYILCLKGIGYLPFLQKLNKGGIGITPWGGNVTKSLFNFKMTYVWSNKGPYFQIFLVVFILFFLFLQTGKVADFQSGSTA
jgi:hypothetical protein